MKIRISRAFCAAVAVVLTFQLLASMVAGASPLREKRAKAFRIKKQIDSIDKKLREIADKYNSATVQLAKINVAIQKTQAQLDVTQRELEKYQGILNKRVDSIYRYGEINFFEVLLGAKDFRDFLVRLDLLEEIGNRDRIVLERVKEIKRKLKQKENELANQKFQQQVLVRDLRTQQAAMESMLVKEKALLSGVENEIAALERKEREKRERRERERVERARLALGTASASRSSSYRISGFVFPVKGPHTYSNSWHAPRKGHLHQGIDIFALKGTPVVACANGVISSTRSGGSGGISLWLRGNDGTLYYYAHLNGYASGIRAGTVVSAGQTIGYVGNTGNARGGASHLHFEIHPGGGRAINPYPILRAADG